MNMKASHLSIVAILMTFLAIGCSGLKVSQDYDKSTDFSRLNSFAWKSDTQEKTGDIRVDNPLLDSRIREAVEQALVGSGFRQASEGTPDFYIDYKLSIRSRVGSDGVNTSVGFGVGSGSRSSGSFGGIGISSGGGVQEWDEGTLVIDITDKETQDLLWRGTATRRVARHATPEETTESVNEMVAKTLAQFPPQP
jgi:hypothetical protein